MTDTAERFAHLMRYIDIPYPWDRDAFVATVARFRGRPIRLHPLGDPALLSGIGCATNISGLWIKTTDSDIVLYSADTEWHADHVIAHEIGHMLLHHDDADPADHSALHTLMPDLAPEAIHHVLARNDYRSDRETAAETFADLLMVQAALPRRRPSAARRTFFRTRHR
ncbi:ImmA/IrrE family metallo-endopeptidase [Nocardia sp. NPDC127579]|uniref:ImmA/IrrE family metallo-endopeptidase n=1 Tax=Nocardia sp. NPDC127579 TaxID=3345402 RepID=UPI003645CD01